MAKEFDIQVLNTVVMGVLEETFKKTCRTELAERPVVVEKEILEYNGCMRVFPLEKFNESAYVAAINYYLSSRNMEKKLQPGHLFYLSKRRLLGNCCKHLERL